MDIVLHYKDGQGRLNDLLLATKNALEEFPCRVLPVFKPWFPSGLDRSLPIKPRNAPPVISSENFEEFRRCKCQSSFQDLVSSPQNGDCAADPKKIEVTSLREAARNTEASDRQGQSRDASKTCKRSWSVISQTVKSMDSTQSFSRRFHKIIERHRLHLHQRAKWIIRDFNCDRIEDSWVKLSRAISHSRLPTCNANFQRSLAQIWVYCDVFYCEYVGNFLKQELKLTGSIVLAVHKLGSILRL
ncbi:shieldin complex subunit 3 [Chanos chanos]|uniref:Shieldin complex subunit 3 n=1 Tax=Chanos chanos TaxID=29144 RepID=A0A6J2UNQ3_CHACN|nr:shieldin complex subunit 3 [Chanos chanos]